MDFSWTKIIGEFGNFKIKSITDTLFKFGTLILFFTLIASWSPQKWVAILLAIIGSLIMLLAIGFYFYFAIISPDYLRSEDFQISNKSIEFLGDKDNYNNPNIDKLTLIASPYAKEVKESKKIEIK